MVFSLSLYAHMLQSCVLSMVNRPKERFELLYFKAAARIATLNRLNERFEMQGRSRAVSSRRQKNYFHRSTIFQLFPSRRQGRSRAYIYIEAACTLISGRHREGKGSLVYTAPTTQTREDLSACIVVFHPSS